MQYELPCTLSGASLIQHKKAKELHSSKIVQATKRSLAPLFSPTIFCNIPHQIMREITENRRNQEDFVYIILNYCQFLQQKTENM